MKKEKLTKREYFVGLAMQGLLASTDWDRSQLDTYFIQVTADKSVQMADAILFELENTK